MLCIEEIKANKEIIKSYIIPNKEFTSSKIIWIPESHQSVWDPYKESWNLLVNNDQHQIESINIESIKLKSEKDFPKDTLSTIQVAEMFNYSVYHIRKPCNSKK